MLNIPGRNTLSTGVASKTALRLSDEEFNRLRNFIRDMTGIYFADNKKYLVESRIQKRLEFLGFSSYSEYIDFLKYSPSRNEELKTLCNLITINETYFFRDEAQLKAFEEKIMPELIQNKPMNGLRRIRIWSAACSSGEEPYTLGMIFLEKIKPRFPDVQVEIVGTDINTAVLEVARKGVYKLYSVRNIPDNYLKKYFKEESGLFYINEELKRFTRFEHLNLVDKFQMMRMRNFDVIFLRNVLIYFDVESRRQVISSVYDSLNRGGYLIVGYSESLRGITKAFKVVYFEKAIAYKKE
jgi:chemotaxis protein methyltransferase CheR